MPSPPSGPPASGPRRLPAQPAEIIDRSRSIRFTFEWPKLPRPSGRHHRLRPGRRRRQHLQPLIQVPPPPRPAVLRRPLPQLPGAGGGRAQRARLPAAGAGGPGGLRPERLAEPGPGPDGPQRMGLAPDAGGLLLQDLHAAPGPLASLRAHPAARRRTGQDRPPVFPGSLRQAVPARRRGRGRRRPGRNQRGPGRRPEGSQGPALRRPAGPGGPPAIQRRRPPPPSASSSGSWSGSPA